MVLTHDYREWSLGKSNSDFLYFKRGARDLTVYLVQGFDVSDLVSSTLLNLRPSIQQYKVSVLSR